MGKHVAYLVISFKVSKEVGVPEWTGAGIYSESARSLTRMGGIIYADVWEADGHSYQEARDNLVRELQYYPDFAWALPWVDDRLIEERAKLLTAMEEKESVCEAKLPREVRTR